MTNTQKDQAQDKKLMGKRHEPDAKTIKTIEQKAMSIGFTHWEAREIGRIYEEYNENNKEDASEGNTL